MNIEVKIKPLSINKAWQGRRFKTQDYKKYEEEFLWLLPKKEMIKGDVEIDLKFYLKKPKRCDVDNFVKPILDFLTKKMYIEDDCFVYKLRAEKIPAAENRIRIKIEKIK